MYAFLSIAKALSDENRVRALMMLSRGELCVCQLIEMFGLAPSTVSKHMSILRQARLVEASKRGKWMYYRLPDEGCPPEAAQAIEWVTNSLARDKRIRADAREVKRVCKMDKEELCERYKK
ncbi:MAG: ArsR/SmtB family transcription factor [Planctomycetota bacterium]|jgi:DNA-binding transcriptional ArsR family regulator